METIPIRAESVDKFFSWEEDEIRIAEKKQQTARKERLERYHDFVVHCLGVAAVANYLHRQGNRYETLWDPTAPYGIEVWSANGYLEPTKVQTTTDASRTELLLPMYQPRPDGVKQQGDITPPSKWFIKGLRLTNWWASCRVMDAAPLQSGTSYEVQFDGVASREQVLKASNNPQMRKIMTTVVPRHELALPSHWVRELLPTGIEPEDARKAHVFEQQRKELSK